MGFDLFVHRFRDGKPAPYPPIIAAEIFDRNAVRPSKLIGVEYQDGGGQICCGKEGDRFDGFMLTEFHGSTICERAFEIAQVTQSLMFWPFIHIGFAITDKAVLAHLPPEFMAERHLIALVQNLDELWAAINAEEDSSDGVVIVFPEV